MRGKIFDAPGIHVHSRLGETGDRTIEMLTIILGAPYSVRRSRLPVPQASTQINLPGLKFMLDGMRQILGLLQSVSCTAQWYGYIY